MQELNSQIVLIHGERNIYIIHWQVIHQAVLT